MGCIRGGADVTDPSQLSVTEAGAAFRDGSLTAMALVQSQLARIADLNPRLHAFVAVSEDQAFAAATQADADFAAGVDRGPLQGIGFAVKDMVDLAGLPTRCGSHQSSDAAATQDAAVVAALRAKGAVPLGKVATYEHALNGPTFDGPFPPPQNPWNPAHITGGSSSGSAAAVASGMVRLAIGTDTGGSIRSPACYCGVVGLKPTFSTMPMAGVHPLSSSLDHVGPMGATVADTALMATAMGLPAATRLGLPVRGLTVGYARDWFAGDPATDPAVLQAMDQAMSDLTLIGMRVELIALPDYAEIEAVGITLLQYQSYSLHKSALKTGRYGQAARAALEAGSAISAKSFAIAQKDATRLRAQMAEALSRHDAIATANVLATAPLMADFAKGAVWTAMRTLPFNVTGHPALALPIGFSDGLPMGMQLVGRDHHEPVLCQIGDAFERATDHTAIRHPL